MQRSKEKRQKNKQWYTNHYTEHSRLTKPHPQIQGVKSGAPEVVQVPLVSLVVLLFGLWLRQTEHISGHLWHRYYIKAKHVMGATVKRYKVCHWQR